MICPAYITATRCAISDTTPMLCVISTSAMPRSFCRLRSRSRICAWIVTSSAVVGSSAISSLGLQAIAMAIITRWFMPPDIWCGKALSRLSGAGIPTCSSSSMQRRCAALASMPRCSLSVSASWKPTVKQGFRLVVGS